MVLWGVQIFHILLHSIVDYFSDLCDYKDLYTTCQVYMQKLGNHVLNKGILHILLQSIVDYISDLCDYKDL